MEPVTATVYTLLRPIRLGFRWHITGLEHIPDRGAVLVASNHISLFDPMVVASVADLRGRRVRFLAMVELFRSPVPRWIFKQMKHIPVARQTDAAKSSLTAALTALGLGECVGIFPEGGLSRDLEPRAGQTGAARLARSSGAPVVPVGVWGTQRVVAPGHKTSYRPRLPIAVSIGPPLSVSDGEDVHEATDRIMAAICAEVARARTGYPPPRRGEDGWWVRSPGTAVLRSCLPPSDENPAPEADVDPGKRGSGR
jgi:1-acyl-sn-glycerol-3-phosphate acyltransferase